MGNERDDLKGAEDVKKGGILAAVCMTVATIGKIVNILNAKNQKDDDMREKDRIDRKFFKTREEKERLDEINNKYK